MDLDSTAKERKLNIATARMDVSMGRKTGPGGRVCCLDYPYYYWTVLSVDHSSMQAGGGAVGTR